MPSAHEYGTHLSPASFDHNGLRLSVEPEARATPPRTPPPQMQEQLLTPGGPRSTMAVLIIKPHATKQRLKIEKRIIEAGFEILKERKIGFHLDGSGAVELFGPDAPSLCGGEPVWVYVLSRPRSASALSALVGPLDPLAARRSDPECLRALYGDNRWENGVWTTRDESSAERIVSELFAGSPIMELSDLPSVGGSPDRRRIRKTPSNASSIRSHLSTENRARTSSNSRGGSAPPAAPAAPVTKSPVAPKARPIPSITTSPSIVPRTTRASDLRAGNAAPTPPRQRQSQEERERMFEGVPGHKRRESISVPSTAAPAITPRQNRSAMLRTQKLNEGDNPALTKFPSMSDSREKQTMSPEELEEKNRAMFEGVPGHKRRESFKVASTAAPAVAPRPNRSSLLRAQKMAATLGVGGAPPSSFKGASSENGPTRTLSTKSSTGSISAASSKADRRASLQVLRPAPATVSSGTNKRLSLVLSRQPSSNSNTGGALTPISNGTRSRPVSVNGEAPQAPPKPSPKKPDIEPRTNKSALLRAAAKLKSAAGVSVGKSTTGRKSFVF